MSKLRKPSEFEFEQMKKFINVEEPNIDEYVVFENLSVGDMIIPNRYKKLDKSFLNVLANDAKKGVALMLNHSWADFLADSTNSLPIGKVFDGRVESESTQDGETNTLYLKKYLKKSDIEIKGISTNGVLERIESGVLSDTSIGFTAPVEASKCSICGENYFSRKCSHYAGLSYSQELDDGTLTEAKLCYTIVYGNFKENSTNTCLIEESLVYDGAYPNAQLSKFSKENEKESLFIEINKTEKENFEDLKNIYMMSNGVDNTFDMLYNKNEYKKGGDGMNKNENIVVNPEEENLANENKNGNENIIADENNGKAADNLSAENNVEDNLTSKNTEITYAFSLTKEQMIETFGIEKNHDEVLSIIKDGMSYKENLISETLKNGVKALGNSFATETYTKILKNASVEEIKEINSGFLKTFEENFNTSGRVSTVKESAKVSVDKDEENYKIK